MKKILQARSTGKTSELLKMCAETKSMIICLDYTRVLQLQKQAKELKLEIKHVISWQEFLYRRDSMRGVSIVIDNADDILENLCAPAKVKAITMTTDE